MIALYAFVTIKESVGLGTDALRLLIVISSSSRAVYAVILGRVPVSRDSTRNALLAH